MYGFTNPNKNRIKTVFLGVRISFLTGYPNTWFPKTHPLELEGVQFFGLVDSPLMDSRVPVDSRFQYHWKVDIFSFQKSPRLSGLSHLNLGNRSKAICLSTNQVIIVSPVVSSHTIASTILFSVLLVLERLKKDVSIDIIQGPSNVLTTERYAHRGIGCKTNCRNKPFVV